MTIRVALDHNFPTPIVDAMAAGIVEAELVPIVRIDKRLTTLDDHEVVRAVWKRDFDVLVSCDEAQIWKLRVGRKAAAEPWRDLERIAQRRGLTAKQLYDSLKLSKAELGRDPAGSGE